MAAPLNNKNHYIHGFSKNALYDVWNGMFRRNYLSESGKKIAVCDEWTGNVTEFISWANKNGYKKGLELDRTDNSKGYSPDNCRFVDGHTSRCNTRLIRSDNTSGYRGVRWHKESKKWRATVTWNSKEKHLGCFGSKKFAALCRDSYIVAQGLPMPLNFTKLAKVGG